LKLFCADVAYRCSDFYICFDMRNFVIATSP
ncbi:hypothetical protein T12_7079, partial [Trichinella patagoniensis]